ncbi:MAG TPA: ADP-ribosylglycohydrolase family protein [Gammaproteobacteria bacterium]|nr:ADP-ribosylglycohydrolase family protein [Gammaproteobacteria bacterium]
MIGAVLGDIVGSVYEAAPIKTTDFPLLGPASTFTDDTVLTCATAEVLLDGGDYAEAYRRYYRRHPERGFGGRFRQWAERDDAGPYGSLGNGSAMRVAPVGWARDDLATVYAEAERSAAVSHDHPEGIRGAQATAGAVFLARSGAGPAALRARIEADLGYDLDRSLAAIRPGYGFDVTCPGSVQEALIAFLEADGYESAVRNAVSLGGDADTQACIAGAVAEARWGVPEGLREQALARLDADLAAVTRRFRARYVESSD